MAAQENTLVTLFYSNYSGNCKALLQLINSSNLMDTLNIKFINIDNHAIQEIVTKKFSVVPSIVVMMDDEISLYSGNNAFEWFNMVISSVREDHQGPERTTPRSDEIVQSQPRTKEDEKDTDKPKTIMEIAAELSKAREKI